MTTGEIKREQRKQRRLAALGTNNPRCGCCGETRWECLEVHHVAGRAHDENATVVLCANCHRLVTQAQKDQPPSPCNADPHAEWMYDLLLGAADLLRWVADQLCRLAKELFLNRPTISPITD
jgi:hypothetical protein